MLRMERHRPLTLSWLVSLFPARQLFLTNHPDNTGNNDSAGRNVDVEEKSDTVTLPPSSPAPALNEGAARPPPPDESPGAAAPVLPQRRLQTSQQTSTLTPRVDNLRDDDEEERPKPSDSLVVAGSCMALLNTVPARDTIDPGIYYAYKPSLFSAGQLFLTNHPDNTGNNDSAGRNVDVEEKSDTVTLPPSSPAPALNEGAARPPPPDESPGATAPVLSQHRLQTSQQTSTLTPRVDNRRDDDEEERPKPSDSLVVAGSCMVLLNTVPKRDTINVGVYYAYKVLLFLALCISICLYVYSLRADSDRADDRRVVKVRKKVVITVAVALVVAAMALRFTFGLTVELVLPLLIIEAAAVLVILYFYLTRKKQPRASATDAAGDGHTLRPSPPGHPWAN